MGLGLCLGAVCLALCLCAAAASCAEEADSPAVRLFDTGAPSAEPLSEVAVTKHGGWKLVPEDDLTHQFVGDAVLLNDKLTIRLPKAGSRVQVFSNTEKGAKRRASVGHMGMDSSGPDSYETLRIIENTSGAATLEAASKRGGWTLRFRLTTGERIAEIRPGGEAQYPRYVFVYSKSRHVIAPDFFGDDMVFKGEPRPSVNLPSENFFLGLLGEGDALLMCAWKSNRQEARLSTVWEGGEPSSWGSVTCEGENPIWLAIIEGPAAWHAQAAASAEAWGPPFPAKWRCSRIGEAAFADSWDLAAGPAPEQQARKAKGPTLIYPFDRTRETPLTAFCLVDLMRNTMGVGPCQYVLAQEGLASEENPTPDGAMAWVEKQFQKKAAAKAADEMVDRFKQMVEQVRLTQARIGRYAAFAKSIRALCTAEKAPEAAKMLLPTVERIEQTVKACSEAAATPERAGQLAAEIVALARKQGALDECQRLGGQVRAIGTAQDRTLSKCRMATRWLRSQAEGTPSTEFARQVRSRAEEILWKP